MKACDHVLMVELNEAIKYYNSNNMMNSLSEILSTAYVGIPTNDTYTIPNKALPRLAPAETRPNV